MSINPAVEPRSAAQLTLATILEYIGQHEEWWADVLEDAKQNNAIAHQSLTLWLERARQPGDHELTVERLAGFVSLVDTGMLDWLDLSDDAQDDLEHALLDSAREIVTANPDSDTENLESGWYVRSSYDNVVLSGPYADEADAQQAIDSEADLAGGVPDFHDAGDLSLAHAELPVYAETTTKAHIAPKKLKGSGMGNNLTVEYAVNYFKDEQNINPFDKNFDDVANAIASAKDLLRNGVGGTKVDEVVVCQLSYADNSRLVSDETLMTLYKEDLREASNDKLRVELVDADEVGGSGLSSRLWLKVTELQRQHLNIVDSCESSVDPQSSREDVEAYLAAALTAATSFGCAIPSLHMVSGYADRSAMDALALAQLRAPEQPILTSREREVIDAHIAASTQPKVVFINNDEGNLRVMLAPTGMSDEEVVARVRQFDASAEPDDIEAALVEQGFSTTQCLNVELPAAKPAVKPQVTRPR